MRHIITENGVEQEVSEAAADHLLDDDTIYPCDECSTDLVRMYHFEYTNASASWARVDEAIKEAK